MARNYTEMICESIEELTELEEKLVGEPTAVRVRMLRLLKTGQARSLWACAPMLGYHFRQLTRWWRTYNAQGLDALITKRPRTHRSPKLTVEARDGLLIEIQNGTITRLKEAKKYLETYWNIHYQSTHGVWWILRRMDILLKQTGTTQKKQESLH
jgi:transposase